MQEILILAFNKLTAKYLSKTHIKEDKWIQITKKIHSLVTNKVWMDSFANHSFKIFAVQWLSPLLCLMTCFFLKQVLMELVNYFCPGRNQGSTTGLLQVVQYHWRQGCHHRLEAWKLDIEVCHVHAGFSPEWLTQIHKRFPVISNLIYPIAVMFSPNAIFQGSRVSVSPLLGQMIEGHLFTCRRHPVSCSPPEWQISVWMWSCLPNCAQQSCHY